MGLQPDLQPLASKPGGDGGQIHPGEGRWSPGGKGCAGPGEHRNPQAITSLQGGISIHIHQVQERRWLQGQKPLLQALAKTAADTGV